MAQSHAPCRPSLQSELNHTFPGIIEAAKAQAHLSRGVGGGGVGWGGEGCFVRPSALMIHPFLVPCMWLAVRGGEATGAAASFIAIGLAAADLHLRPLAHSYPVVTITL